MAAGYEPTVNFRMKQVIVAVAFVIAFFTSLRTHAQDLPPCPPEYKLCLTKSQHKVVIDALKELRNIKKSQAELTFKDDVIIIHDWEKRIYVNGGDKKPLRLELKLGTVNRELEATLPVQVHYREEPPDPPFRFRLRAQGGILPPQIFQSIRDEEFHIFWTGSVGLDFLHYDFLNLSAVIGVSGIGGAVGVDLTKNFGIYAGPVVLYDEWQASLDAGVYFAF